MAKWSVLDDEPWDYFQPSDRDQTPQEMVQEYANLSRQVPDPRLYEGLIWEEMKEWQDEVDPEAELKELADLVYVIYGYANARGWDLDETLRRVHENNVGRMYQPDGTIQYRADGKVLKNKDFPKVVLGDLI